MRRLLGKPRARACLSSFAVVIVIDNSVTECLLYARHITQGFICSISRNCRSWAILWSLLYEWGAGSIRSLEKLLTGTQLMRKGARCQTQVWLTLEPICASVHCIFFFFSYNHLVIRHLLDVDFGYGSLFGEIEGTNRATVLALRYWHFIWGSFCCWMKTVLISKQKEGNAWNMKAGYHTDDISTVCFQRPTCLHMSPSHSSALAVFTNALLGLCLSLILLASVCPQGNH